MSSTINASTAGIGGLVSSADSSGILKLQTAGVDALTIDASQKVTFAKTITPVVDSLNGGQLAGLRNRIINGNMDIAQRGTAAVTVDKGYGPADRWQTNTNTNTFSTTIAEFVSGDTLYDTGGARYYTTAAVTSVTGAGNATTLNQNVENVRILAGQTVTVSFWAKAVAGAPLIGVSLNQNFGTGGSPSSQVNGVGQNLTLSTTWTKYTKTFTLGSLSGKTLGTDENSSFTVLSFWLDAGATYNTRSGSIGQASKTVSIAQIQLEIGSVATPFEQRPYGMELALCQRYYQQFGGVTANERIGTSYNFLSTQSRVDIPLIVAMRATPALSISSAGDWAVEATNGTFACTTITQDQSSTKIASIDFNVSTGLVAGQGAHVMANSTSNARLNLSSEL